tara:strand:+ start:59128 stop:59526 length:399 start_codon:yes stop_codon:yes gene_type:complete
VIFNFFLILVTIIGMDDEVAIENIVGNWERVCLDNDALGFQVSHCNFFGDREMQINEWNYIEMIYKNGERSYYDFKLDGDKIDIYHKYRQVVESSITLKGDTLIIDSNEVYNELMNRKFEANYNRVFFVRNN